MRPARPAILPRLQGDTHDAQDRGLHPQQLLHRREKGNRNRGPQ